MLSFMYKLFFSLPFNYKSNNSSGKIFGSESLIIHFVGFRARFLGSGSGEKGRVQQ